MPRYDDDSDLDYETRPRRRPRRAPEKPDNRLIITVLCLGAGLFLLAAAGAVVYVLVRDKGVAPGPAAGGAGGGGVGDVERLAGSWECTFRDPTGRVTMRKVKQIVGTTETATWYRPDGTVFRINRVEFALAMRGPDKVFRYFNGLVVQGPDAGHVFPSGEYVYTLEGDTWTEYDPGGVIVWTRRR